MKNKLALVTGSSRGIGAAIAIRLAADGASVIVNYAAYSGTCGNGRQGNPRCRRISRGRGADLSTIEGTNKLIAYISQAFGGSFGGRLDILVNNAGTVVFGPFMEGAEDSYDKHFNLNVRSVIALSKDAARRMIPQKWGRIINIGSIHGASAPIPGVTMYVASKFAVHGFTRGLSRELGATGVTVNAVQPGFIDTELSPADSNAEAMKKLTSVGRFGRAEEIASAVAFLAHPDSAFINGGNLTVDGGWSA